MQKEKNPFRYTVVMYMLLIAVAVPLFFILFPVMKENISRSGIKERYEMWRKNGKEGMEKEYEVTLFSPSGAVSVSRRSSSSDSMHALLEALLLPLSDEEKEKGIVTYIPEGTSLVGVTEKDGFFFVSLSSSFLTTADMEKAYDEIKKTLEKYYTLESLAISVGNTVIKL